MCLDEKHICWLTLNILFFFQSDFSIIIWKLKNLNTVFLPTHEPRDSSSIYIKYHLYNFLLKI